MLEPLSTGRIGFHVNGKCFSHTKEIEILLAERPGVLEGAVVGVPHPYFGETFVAVLLPKKDSVPNVEQIVAALKCSLAGLKRSRLFDVVETLFRNTMQKVQKNTLRGKHANAFHQSAS